MCFHGNQHPWAIKHPFISLYSKYQSLDFICLPVMYSPVFPSLDDIFCMPCGDMLLNWDRLSKWRTICIIALLNNALEQIVRWSQIPLFTITTRQLRSIPQKMAV